MPKPFFIRRPSGIFCRFLVPANLQGLIGSRYIVRALRTDNWERARLLAAILSIAITQIFERTRAGENLDIKKLLASGQLPPSSKWGAAKMTLPGGTVIENIKIDTQEDHERITAMIRELSLLSGNVRVVESEDDRGGLLAQRVDQFLTEKKAGELSAKNIADAEFALLTLLLPLCGNKAINEINSDDADKIVDALLKWPTNATKKAIFKGLTTQEIIDKAVSIKAAMLKPRTREKYLDRLRAFFGWCEDNQYLRGKNPFSNRRMMTKDRRGKTQKTSFSDADLELIFNPILRATFNEPHKFWCPVIAIFTGARLNEIAQLYLSDFYPIDDLWIIKIDTDKPDKKLKNLSSERAIPVHQTLIDLGLLDYIKDVRKFGFQRLFPNLPANAMSGYGDAVGDWFNGRFLRPAPVGSKILRAGISDRAKSFHSFRHVVFNRLYRITSDTLLITEISGHIRGDNVLSNVYIDPNTAKQRAEILNQITYPNLIFESYVAGQFDGFFRRLTNKQSREKTDT